MGSIPRLSPPECMPCKSCLVDILLRRDRPRHQLESSSRLHCLRSRDCSPVAQDLSNEPRSAYRSNEDCILLGSQRSNHGKFLHLHWAP